MANIESGVVVVYVIQSKWMLLHEADLDTGS